MNMGNKNFFENKVGGYALLEFLFYISFFAALSLAVISAIITMTSSFKETAFHTESVQSARILVRIWQNTKTTTTF